MDAETWDRQPYWAQRIYREGLEVERPWEYKPASDPESWWTPLANGWNTFGDLDTSEVQEETTKTTPEPRPKAEKLPDITAAGRTLKIVKGKGKD